MAGGVMGFWRGKRVFVTGHTGFKGGWLCAWLERLGAEVFGLSLAADTAPSLCELTGLEGRIGFVHGDVRDAGLLMEAMRKFGPDVAFHLAAQPLVRRSYREPVETVAVNVMGTVNFLEALRAVPSVKAAVVVTSDKCYENDETGRGFVEGDKLGGKDVYSASKACAELVTRAWRDSFFGGEMVATARAGNVIGGGDWAQDRLVPDCVRAIFEEREIEIRNPGATRPWQHVLEPVGGYIRLAERLVDGGVADAWNFGPVLGDVWPVSRVVDAVIAHCGRPALWRVVGAAEMEAGVLAVDASAARVALGWRPVLGVEKAIEWTMEWYKRQQAGEPARALVFEQIERYEAMSR